MNLIQTYINEKTGETVEAIQVSNDPNTLSNICGWLGQSGDVQFVRLFEKGKNYPEKQVLETHIEFDTDGPETQTAQVYEYVVKSSDGAFTVRHPVDFEASHAIWTHFTRLLTEAQEVARRLNTLNTFMASNTFPQLEREDKDLLYSQQRAMSKYIQILGKRLERAGCKFKHPQP